jgi:hypothetical protein
MPQQPPRADYWLCSRPACSGLSIPKRRAREHDVGANCKPKGVVAHDRYLDEHAEDREDHHNE